MANKPARNQPGNLKEVFNDQEEKGFTLIELLIVVAIIGILAALLIPNAMTALQKAKQKTAMKEIMTMSTGAMDYITDHGDWTNITQNGDITGQHRYCRWRSLRSTSSPVPSMTRGTPLTGQA